MAKGKIARLILIVIILAFSCDYYIQKERFYNKSMPLILQNIYHGKYLRQLLDVYYLQFGQYPVSLEQLDRFVFGGREDNSIADSLRWHALIDPFSSNSEYYFYQPIFKREFATIESYVLLSRGLDGRINNSFKDSVFVADSLVIKDYFEKGIPTTNEEIRFRYLNRLFGRRDYDLNPFRWSGPEMLTLNARDCLSVSDLISNIDDDINWRVFCLRIPVNELTINSDYIYFDSEKRVRLVFKDLVYDFSCNDTLNLVGIVDVIRDNEEINQIIFRDVIFR